MQIRVYYSYTTIPSNVIVPYNARKCNSIIKHKKHSIWSCFSHYGNSKPYSTTFANIRARLMCIYNRRSPPMSRKTKLVQRQWSTRGMKNYNPLLIPDKQTYTRSASSAFVWISAISANLYVRISTSRRRSSPRQRRRQRARARHARESSPDGCRTEEGPN